jgi:hypothetical protein
MNAINNEPIFADVNNCDQDGAVRLSTRGTLHDLDRLQLKFEEGQVVWISDGEIELLGNVTTRDGQWVAVPIAGSQKAVDKNSPHHIDKRHN